MNRHAFRSVCSRTRPELEQVSDTLHSYFRSFSTTQWQAADNDAPKPTLRERTRTAASQINSLARDRSPSRAPQAPSAGGPGKQKVIDVKSLPRSPLGRGGFRGRGGFGAGSRGGSSLRGGSSFRGRGGTARGGRGGAGFRGRGRGRGGKGLGRRKDEDGEDKEKERKRQAAAFDVLDPDEQAFDNGMRFGVRTKYSPTLTLDSLSEFAPIIPTSAAGKNAAVLENLSVLGTADPVGAPQTLQARHLATEVEQNGLRFFADLKSKDAAEKYLQANKPVVEGEEAKADDGPLIASAEEAIRKVVIEKAVQGQHEAPKHASDTIGVSRAWHLRAETYTTKDVNTFEKKLTTLLAGRNAGKGKKQQNAKA
ncbi:Fc.00g019260.m01.CDS01 [Cosmosporella sp. VM-42]